MAVLFLLFQFYSFILVLKFASMAGRVAAGQCMERTSTIVVFSHSIVFLCSVDFLVDRVFCALLTQPYVYGCTVRALRLTLTCVARANGTTDTPTCRRRRSSARVCECVAVCTFTLTYLPVRGRPRLSNLQLMCADQRRVSLPSLQFHLLSDSISFVKRFSAVIFGRREQIWMSRKRLSQTEFSIFASPSSSRSPTIELMRRLRRLNSYELCPFTKLSWDFAVCGAFKSQPNSGLINTGV